jgi:hypothetical protein
VPEKTQKIEFGTKVGSSPFMQFFSQQNVIMDIIYGFVDNIWRFL